MRQRLLAYLVGSGRGSGMAVLYLIIATVGVLGCCYFKRNKALSALDIEEVN